MRPLRALILGVASLALACEAPPGARPRGAEPTTLVLIHTADLHSHLFPERVQIAQSDAARGLGTFGQVSAVGGFARIASIVHDMRAGAEHSLFLDSGDLIEGTAAFTTFRGEPELRAFSALHVGAVALGNHDLDPGSPDFLDKHRRFAQFPVLAGNVADNGSELASALLPSVVLDANGLRVGVIGVANPSSPNGLSRADNPYGIQLLPLAAAVQSQIERLRPQADVIVAISHLGLAGDESLIRNTSGLDVVLGGHQHLVLERAEERLDCGPQLKAERGCQERRVILIHSGALGRYVGEVDLALVPAAGDSGSAAGLEVESAAHSLVPVSAQVPEDPALAALLEPYRADLHAAGFDTPLAFALALVERYGPSGGDSALGNLITDAIRARTAADVVILNTTGIRSDLPPGELSEAAFVAALPFGDTLVQLSLSGAQLRALLNQQARVASSRHCQSPLQISGLKVEFRCSGSASSAALQLTEPARELDSRALYSLVTSTYLANGGSGFALLTEVVVRHELDADPLRVLLDAVHDLPECPQSTLPCVDPAALRDGRIVARGG